jgi:hypothetical protein
MGDPASPETAATEPAVAPVLDRGSREVRGAPGFWYADVLELDVVLRRVITRALLALAVSMAPEYETETGAWKPKRAKRREFEHALAEQMLRVLSKDFGLRAKDGWTEHPLRNALLELGAARGVFRLVEHDGNSYYEVPPALRLEWNLARGDKAP